jgi:hypothetical protein
MLKNQFKGQLGQKLRSLFRLLERINENKEAIDDNLKQEWQSS